MHISGIQIYEQSALPGGVQGFKNILAQVESRLHMARTFRQKIVHVPFKGEAPALIDVIAGHVPMMFSNITASIAFVQSGRLRMLAQTVPVGGVNEPSQAFRPAVP